MFKSSRVLIDACGFNQAKQQCSEIRKEVFERDGNTVERHISDNGSAVEKVSQPSGRHWHVFVPHDLVV